MASIDLKIPIYHSVSVDKGHQKSLKINWKGIGIINLMVAPSCPNDGRWRTDMRLNREIRACSPPLKLELWEHGTRSNARSLKKQRTQTTRTCSLAWMTLRTLLENYQTSHFEVSIYPAARRTNYTSNFCVAISLYYCMETSSEFWVYLIYRFAWVTLLCCV